MKPEFIILTVVLIAAGFLLFLFIAKILSKRKETIPQTERQFLQDFGAVKAQLSTMQSSVSQQNQAIQEIKGLVSEELKHQDRLHTNIQNTSSLVERLKTEYETRKNMDDENRRSLQRLEEIIAGTKSKGIAGENILKEALAVFPHDMIVNNFRIKGKEVEFGLLLPNNKIIPIDSKWPSTDLIDSLSREKDIAQKSKIKNSIEKELSRRVNEVAQYIDVSTTMPWAVCAIPDGVYAICSGAHFDAHKKNVILISYSMLVPYLLTHIRLYQQYSSTIDLEYLYHALSEINSNLNEMTQILENSVVRAGKMITNASDDLRQLISSSRGCVLSVQSKKTEEKELKQEV